MDEKLHWLWLSSLKGFGSVTMLKYLRAFNTVTELYDASPRDLEQIEGATKAEIKALGNKSLKKAEEIAEECRMREVRILPIDDPDYPTWLRTIYDPPCVLYVRGELPDLNRRVGLAVVGTRRASKYGLDCASSFAAELAEAGAVVISGLAEGIDSAAVSAAIKAHGTVIGVLGTGVDRAFPTWNAPLHRETAQNGALVSEYPPGTPSTRGSFPRKKQDHSGSIPRRARRGGADEERLSYNGGESFGGGQGRIRHTGTHRRSELPRLECAAAGRCRNCS